MTRFVKVRQGEGLKKKRYIKRSFDCFVVDRDVEKQVGDCVDLTDSNECLEPFHAVYPFGTSLFCRIVLQYNVFLFRTNITFSQYLLYSNLPCQLPFPESINKIQMYLLGVRSFVHIERGG